MAARGGPMKRKWGDGHGQGDHGDGGSRTSPHRPADLSLAQHGPNSSPHPERGHHGRGRGQRGGRSGRGGRGYSRSPQNSPNGSHFPQRSSAAQSASSPAQQSPAPARAPVEQPPPPKQETPSVTKATQTPPPPPSPPAPYAYTYLTDDAIQGWAESGRTTSLDIGTKAVSENDSVALAVLYQEIVRAALDRRLDPSEAGSLVKDIIAADTVDDAPSTWINAASSFLDSIAVGEYLDWELPALKILLASSEIPVHRMRVEFDVDFLAKIGLVRDTFNQKRARHQTNVLYRQSNYNLLREETEGYSKLVTELFSSSGGEPPNHEEVTRTYERVRSMIGTFDLDIGRVLDIHLDVFAAVLVRHYRYFVKYLRISSWWPEQPYLDTLRASEVRFNSLPPWALPEHNGYYSPSEEEMSAVQEARERRDTDFWDRLRLSGVKAFFELGGARVYSEQAEELVRGEGAEADERRAWAKETGLMPPPGNKVAAQILGFKLRFYSSDARSPADTLPANLIHLAALLIKIGFISLVDLYPHIWPYDDDMAKVKDQKMKEKQEREMGQRPGGGRLNALAMAGSLGDEPGMTSTSRPKDESKTTTKSESKAEEANDEAESKTKPELPEPADQKIQLLTSLLCIGALPEALYILGRFPWLVDVCPELPEHIHRILHHCLSKVYEDAHSIGDIHEAQMAENAPDLDQSGVAKGSLRLLDQPAPKILRWSKPDRYDADQAVEYRFYWEEWCDNIPVCQTVDDFFTLCGTLLNLSGVKIGQDCLLLSKIARIGRYSLATDNSDANRKRWIDLSKRLVVPSLSLTKNNSGAVAEVWELIKQFSLPTRYNMYAEWFTGQTSRLDDIKVAFEQTRAETKDVLKRISKTNMKAMARSLSKISTASPGVVFSVALNQIESYENLIDVIVDCARYFTFLSYDILTWTLMSSLGAGGRNRVQADGMLRSKWLNALATFSGKVFKKYNTMSATPIMQYVASQLGKGNTTDLVVLEELTTSMAGIVSDALFNDSQIIAMGGGPLLQGQVMLQLLDRRHESSVKATSRRLMKSLIEPKLIGPLLISMAQEWQTCIYRVPEDEANLKVLANLFDETHRILIQYLDLLRSNLTIEEFKSFVPSLTELIGSYGLEPQIAFWISRPNISTEMSDYDKRIVNGKKEASQAKENDTKASDSKGKTTGVTESSEPAEGIAEPSASEDADVEMKDTQEYSEPDHPWHPILKSVVDLAAPLLPQETWEVLSQHFYFTFWQLSLEDIFVPMQSYDEENNRLKRKVMAINSDRSDLSSRGKEKKDEEKKAITDLQTRLQAEMGVRIAAYQRTKQRINKEKDVWFAEYNGKFDALNVAILEHCFIPRLRLSSVDALYTFKILKHLHSVGTKNLRTVGLLDQFFNTKRLSALIYVCTAREAENLGKFINELIKELARWHADKAVYEKEAYGTKKDLPGFKAKTGDKGTADLMDFESFRTILGKWHTQLHNALKSSLSGGEYMHIRNAINILKAISANFPAINWMGQAELTIVTELGKSETREDLKLSSMSLLGSLKRREKSWVMSQAFMLNTAKPSAGHQARATGNGVPPVVVDKASKTSETAPDTKAVGNGESASPASAAKPAATQPASEAKVGSNEHTTSQSASTAKKEPNQHQQDAVANTTGASSQPQSDMPPPSATEKVTNGTVPTKPPPRSTGSYNNTRSAPDSAPPTPPADGAEAPGVHPDRLRSIQGSNPSLPPRPGPASNTPSGQRAPHTQTPNSAPARNNTPSYERSRDKRFAGLNNILQQPSPTSSTERGGANVRGQAARANNLPPSPATNTPPPRYGPAGGANLPPRPEQHAPRKELFSNHSSSGPGFREDVRPSERDSGQRPPRSRDTRSVSPRRPPNFEGGHPPASRDDSGRLLRSREEPPRPREDMRETRGRPPPPAAERDIRRPPPRDDAGGSYSQLPRDARRGPPREDHAANDVRERHPNMRSGAPPPAERDEARSLRPRDEPPRRGESDSRERRGRPPPAAAVPERDLRRGPPRDEHAERERYPAPRGAGPSPRDDYAVDARDRERYPPSSARAPLQSEREDGRPQRHRDADMRELRSRPGPALAAMERDARRGPPPRDDHGGHGGAHGHMGAAADVERDRPPPRAAAANAAVAAPGPPSGGLRDSTWGHDRLPPERGHHPRDQRGDMGSHRGGRGDPQGHRRDAPPPPMDGRGGMAGGMEDGGSGRKRGRPVAEDGYGEQKRTRR